MRMILYILLLLLLCSCAHERSRESLKSTEAVNEMYDTEMLSVDMSEASAYQRLSTQKLRDLYELLVLQKQYPEFGDDISLQLKKLSEDRISIPDSITVLSVENVRQAGPAKYVSDSVQERKLYFTIVTENAVLADSITAIIRRNTILMDNEEVISTSVTFSKE